MRPPLQPQDLVITLLGTYARRGRTVWSGGLVALLGRFGFSPGAARVALARLVRRGLIERVRAGRLVHYRVTARAERLLAEGDRRIFALGRPRGRGRLWTVLWHRIPVDRRLERHRLARRLRFLGFGSLQDGLWVAPYDHAAEVGELLGELEVTDFATVFVGQAASATGPTALVSRAWDVDALTAQYEAFCAEFAPYLRARVRTSDPEAFDLRTRLVHQFRGFPQLDPELPEELAPLSRPRGRAVEIFNSLYERWAAPAQRHFNAVTAGPGLQSAGIESSGRRAKERR